MCYTYYDDRGASVNKKEHDSMNFKLDHVGICDDVNNYSPAASPASYKYIVK